MAQPRYRIQVMNPGTWEAIDYFEETVSVKWSRKANAVGDAKIVVPETLPISSFPRNTRILIWREKDGNQHLAGQTMWIVRKIRQDLENGFVEFHAKDANILIENRLVAYTTGGTYGEKTQEIYDEAAGYAPSPMPVSDDMIKEFVSQNMGADALDSDRDLETAGLLVIEDNLGLGTYVQKAASFQNLLSTIQDVANQGKDGGTPVYFDMVPNTVTGTFVFRTWVDFRGRNRGASSDNPLVFSQELGNISKVELEFDYTTEYNILYLIGEGSDGGEVVEEYENAASVRADPFSRREWTYKEPLLDNDHGEMDAIGPGLLAGQVATVNLKARAIDTPLSRYGVDFEWGDIVTARAGSYEFDCFVEAVAASYANGEEKLDMKLSATVPVLT
jgi:hypothetical protein